MKKFLLMLFVVSLFSVSVPTADAGPLCKIGRAVKSIGKRVKNRKRRPLRRLFGRRCG